ncbi:hypothetical protein Srot_2937 [Segniliparus rotundus DSM 44985]|jgi:hypothetical protein|uniref:Uncharacterized protein n=1 Tax=Segniliparus rotundus (strain ATCC BAA-972 / CDC 1076 / CIP 108378 / DSM 44985 / JCM 13578) TaxID=640132 RepID=D6ZDV9_SEGRD|nr:hypothetical protein [Segniliparus rotundus]ADG99366.1 hypothetical protein Srot_2937 [Segniliparus rotundus DSM 44985]
MPTKESNVLPEEELDLDEDIEPLPDETALQARRVVAAYAQDVDECRTLLAMLGIGPTQRADV